MEKRHLTKLLSEERTWYCTLVRDYQGVMVSIGFIIMDAVTFVLVAQNVGTSMIGDLQRLQDISQDISVTITQSNILPEKSIEFIAEMCPLASQGNVNDFQGAIYLFLSKLCVPCLYC